eukprot:GDKJ01022035.1.p1 GENE.GDKJ01022035.1~~GDKJ01022035.1.p1  ORF type:complete len:1258 (-),score=92.11 GDKJ01022035.1:573-4346(-)
MKWIDSTDIRNWANRRDCQELLPLLVRKLIRATSNTIQNIKFPAGDSISFGGWDGILEVKESTDFLPDGISLWEFGTSKNPKGKADDDYLKRTTNPLEYSPSESTFIFVTPRLWQNEKDWIEEKRKEGIWKDIKVINAELLEEWIELAPTVGAWLAKHLGKYPSVGIQPTDDFWEEWTSGPNFKLTPEVLLGGRKAEQQKLILGLYSSSVIGVQGSSREEALAFIISCVKNNQETEEDFFSRSIIVDSIEVFRELALHDNSLILIPRFEDHAVANRAVEKGHIVIFPLGADATNWPNKIVLPNIDRDCFIEAFTQIGISKIMADRLSKETARNITIVRRQLEFERIKPIWAKQENVADIIPILIVGRWDENIKSDTEIIASIAGDSYSNYIKRLSKWLNTSDSPIVKIGNKWRLSSPLDAWSNASNYLTSKDFELLANSFKLILTEVNPALELSPEVRYMASIYGKKRKYSSWIREGILQSLILVSTFGERLQFHLPTKADLWIDGLIAELLNSDSIDLWKSLDDKLPLIAEASPFSFLEALDKHLVKLDNSMLGLFEEEPNFIFSRSYHIGLLWALESLAWFPQYLSRTSLILAKLSVIDPGGNVINRPINSLKEIFKSWHYQTFASFDERMQVLNLICKNQPEIGWELLLSMLPKSIGDTAITTHKTRWKSFEQVEITYTRDVMFRTHSEVIDILINIFDNSETKLTTLIEKSVNLSTNDMDRLLTFIEANLTNVKQYEFTAWHEVRSIIEDHSSHPESDWVLSEKELDRFQRLYKRLQPVNEIERVAWMFDNSQFSFPKGLDYKNTSHRDRMQYVLTKRIEILSDIYQNNGIEKVIEIKGIIKETQTLGDVLAYIVNDDKEIIHLCEFLNSESSDLDFIQHFLLRKSFLNDFVWIQRLYEKLSILDFKNSSLAKLLIPIKQTKQLWDFIDSQEDKIVHEYWKNMNPNFYSLNIDEKVFGLKRLIISERILSAGVVSSIFIEEIPSEILVEILKKMPKKGVKEKGYIGSHDLSQLFEEIDSRNDIDLNEIAQLEWLYFPLLNSKSINYKPKQLYQSLASNPEFFIGIFKWIYLPDDTSKLEELRADLTNEQVSDRAAQAFMLLRSWENIPGVDDFGNIDFVFLKGWIEKVRELAVEYGRLKAADSLIGGILAQYPENKDKVWPPDEICNLIEMIKSENLDNGFSAGVHNKAGASFRGVFDGGTVERARATYFYSLAVIHRNKFPRITAIFERCAKGYENSAKSEDEKAEQDKLEY